MPLNPHTSLVQALCLSAGLLSAAVLKADAPAATGARGVVRTEVLRQDASIPGHQAHLLNVVLAPGAFEGRHTHAGDVFGFVLEGSPSMEREGSPTVTLHAGDAFFVPAGLVHQGTNPGPTPARLAVVLLAPKDRPLTTPAP